MTVREMQIAFMREISAINPLFETTNIPDSDTIMYYLNSAQEKYLKQTYASKSSVKDNVELITKKLDDISALVTRKLMLSETVDTSNSIIDNTSSDTEDINTRTVYVSINPDGSIQMPTPVDYFYYIRSSSKVTGTYLNSSNHTWISNKILDDLSIPIHLLNNAYNSPIIRNPFIVLEYKNTDININSLSNTTMLLYKDLYTTVYNLELIYIRKPKLMGLVGTSTVVTTSELPTSSHREILELAISTFIDENIVKQPSK